MERWYAEACKQRSEAEEENFNLNKKRVFWKDEMEEACGEITWRQAMLGITFSVIFYTFIYLILANAI